MLEEEIERLPFLGTAEIVERLARADHQRLALSREWEAVKRETTHPQFAVREPQREDLGFWDLLKAGRRAIKQVSAEIACASTAEAAAVADVRNMYFEKMEDLERDILTTAKHKLSRTPEADLVCQRFIGFAGYGRRTVDADLESIPPRHWEAGDMDWTARRLTVRDEGW